MDKTEHYETFHITYRDENDGDLSTNGERKKKTYSRDYKKSLAFRAVVTLYTQGDMSPPTIGMYASVVEQ